MAKRSVALKGDFNRNEAKAASTITPGDLIELTSSGTVRRHSTVGQQAIKAFALENDLVGQGIADDYDANDVVQYGVFPPGSEVYARLGAGLTAIRGDFLESNGNGTLKAASTPVEQSLVGQAMETQSVAGGRVRLQVV